TFGHPGAAGNPPPLKVNFKFNGPEAEAFGYRAENIRAHGVYVAPDLRLQASGAGYGATATTNATFHFPARGPFSYSLAGRFDHLDMRRLPRSLAMPKLETLAAGEYQFTSDGVDWTGHGTLAASTVEGARVDPGTTFEVDSRDRALHYAASGTVHDLNPYRFAFP